MKQPELSIVVPILNESAELPDFLADLQRQQQVFFELLFVDGGSVDGGLEWLQQLQLEVPFAVLQSERGRARQLNHGVRQANADWLLFLHVDSRFSDPLALRNALDLMQQAGSSNLAGHFALRFRRCDEQPAFGYYYYAWKARLGRPETIHGDQGFVLQRNLFEQLNGFNETMRVMEDTDFAERVREIGQWRLLPMEISTSARRFEIEGLWQRQLLGALIMCFRDIGWEQFFAESRDIYRQQAETEQLQLRPFFRLIRNLFSCMGYRAAWRIWWQSGSYVRRHGWQLTFALDARLAFNRGVVVGQGSTLLTRIFEPLYELFTDNPLGRLAATLMLRFWFEVTDFFLRSKDA
ncbi:TIGR04283 family arsenosugar biosynthesis glycosyltransferase [Malonomonas rubra]|uniref:TIGR04283 family arsenosugar biosynthesis glycosyltransferase n=1 Tax=Malonomonas rubra TaxID=57040 RepID=UPI0026EEBC86|nr:TIGR04283 family arsenosugar biosynthesis glycosyltransferase [Malonomonas rubra]